MADPRGAPVLERHRDDVEAAGRLAEAARLEVELREAHDPAPLPPTDRGYVMETGRIVLAGPAADLLADDHVRRAYLGA